MKNSTLFLLLLVTLTLISCGEKAAAPTPEETGTDEKIASLTIKKVNPKGESYKEIRAEIAAIPEIKTPGSPGDLKVWVGDKSHNANFPLEMESASAVIQSSVNPKSVETTPDAPEFVVLPVTNACVKYDPTGTTQTFQLTPKHKQEGTYRVGATVRLYGEPDCKGTPVSKDPTSIYVRVRVVWVLTDELYDSIEKNIDKLIGGIAAAIVAFLIYRLRRILGLQKEPPDEGR